MVGQILTQCCFDYGVPRTFVALHLALPTPQEFLKLVMERGRY